MGATETITRLLLEEARLIDEWKLQAWLDLFTEGASYWLPLKEDSNPKTSASILYDDLTLLKARVHQLLIEDRVAQTPRSETMHLVTNIEIDDLDGSTATARYNLVVIEFRTGDWRQKGIGNQRLICGRCTLQLRIVAGAWKIHEKRVLLINREMPIEGLSFIV